MSVILKSPREMMTDIARRARAKRLGLNWSQATLSQNSGVSLGTLKKFERFGQISLESLLKVALALDAFDKFDGLFITGPEELPSSIDALLVDTSRKRGRQ